MQRTAEEQQKILQEAEAYFLKLEAGYNRLTDGTLKEDAFNDLSELFIMAQNHYEGFCKENGITAKKFTDIAYKEKPGPFDRLPFLKTGNKNRKTED